MGAKYRQGPLPASRLLSTETPVSTTSGDVRKNTPGVKSALMRWWQWLNVTRPQLKAKLPIDSQDSGNAPELTLSVKLAQEEDSINQRVSKQLQAVRQPHFFGWRPSQLDKPVIKPSKPITSQVSNVYTSESPTKSSYTSPPNSVVIDALFEPIQADLPNEHVIQQQLFDTKPDGLTYEETITMSAAQTKEQSSSEKCKTPQPSRYSNTSMNIKRSPQMTVKQVNSAKTEPLNGEQADSISPSVETIHPSEPLEVTIESVDSAPASPTSELATIPSNPAITYALVPYAEAFADVSVSQYNHRVYQNLFLAREIDQLARHYFEKSAKESNP